MKEKQLTDLYKNKSKKLTDLQKKKKRIEYTLCSTNAWEKRLNSTKAKDKQLIELSKNKIETTNWYQKQK